MDRTQMIEHLVTNCTCGGVKFDEEMLENKTDEELTSMVDFYKEVSVNEQVVKQLNEGVLIDGKTYALNEEGILVTNDTDDSDDDDEEEEEPVSNAFDITKLPANIRADLEFAASKRQQERNELVQTITANEDFAAVYNAKDLEAMETPELTKLAKLAENVTKQPDFSGQATPAGPIANNQDLEPLEIPTLNFSD